MIAQIADKAKRRARKVRLTRDQVKESLALFAPSPSFEPKITRVKIIQGRGNLLAFLDVDLYLNETRIFLLRGVRIVKQNDGSVYCQLPHQKSERDARYYPIVCCYDQKLKQQIQNAALAAYHEAVSDPVIQLAMNLQEVQA